MDISLPENENRSGDRHKKLQKNRNAKNAGTRNELCAAGSVCDETAKVSPGVTGHPGLHVLISNEASLAFAKPRRCVLVPQAISGTEVGIRTRSRVRSLGSIEPRAESSKKRILRLPKGGTKITGNIKSAQEGIV